MQSISRLRESVATDPTCGAPLRNALLRARIACCRVRRHIAGFRKPASSMAGVGTQRDHSAQASLGYTFDNGIDISGGYAQLRAAETDFHVLGLRLTKSFEFATRN